MLWVPSTTAIIGRPANLRRTKRPKAADNGVAMNSCEFAEIGRFRCNPAGCVWSVPDRVRCQGRCCHPWTGGRQTTNLEERLVARLAALLAAFGY